MKYRIPLTILFIHLILIAALAWLLGGSAYFVDGYAMLGTIAIGVDVIAVILIAVYSKRPGPYIAGLGLTIAALLVIIFFATSQSEFSR